MRKIFVENSAVFEAVVSGNVKESVDSASVSCKVKENAISSVQPKRVEFSNDHSQFIKTHSVTVNGKQWLNGDMVTCTTKDTNNNRDIKQETRFSVGGK